MSAMTRSPACRGGRRQHERQLGRRERDGQRGVDARPDELAACRPRGRSAGRPTRSGRAMAFTSATTVSARPVSAAVKPVPNIASTMTSAVRELAASAAPSPARSAISTDGNAQPAEDVEVDRGRRRGRRRRSRGGTPRRRRRAARSTRATTNPSPPLLPAAAQHGRPAGAAGRRSSPPSPPRPAGPRSPSARSRGCRSPRSCADRLRASGPRSGLACAAV